MLCLIPIAAFDYNNTVQVIPFPPGGIVPDLHQYYLLPIYEDGLEEDTEGFVLYMDVVESQLDPRDVGQIDLARTAYLVTINQSGILIHLHIHCHTLPESK